MKTYRPFYAEPPCEILRYHDEPFTNRNGDCGIRTIVTYLDKKGKEQTATSRVKWTHTDPEVHKSFIANMGNDTSGNKVTCECKICIIQ